MNQEGFGSLIESDRGDGMTACIRLPTYHESDLVLDQLCGKFWRDGKETHVETPCPQPIGRRPFWRAAERDLGGHFLGRDDNTTSRKRYCDTGGNTSLVCLDRSTKWQADALSRRVLVQVPEKLAMKRRAQLSAPAFDFGMVVRQFCDIQLSTCKRCLCVTVC